MIFVENGELIAMSEQHLIDYDVVTGHDCKCRLMENLFTYDEAGDELCSEEEYSYEQASSSCRKDDCTPVPGTVVK